MVCVSKASPAEKRGRAFPAGAPGAGQPLLCPEHGPSRGQAARRWKPLLPRAQMEVPAVLPVAGVSSAIKIVCSFNLWGYNEQQPFSGHFLLYYVFTHGTNLAVGSQASHSLARVGSELHVPLPWHCSCLPAPPPRPSPLRNGGERDAPGHRHSCPIFLQKCSLGR